MDSILTSIKKLLGIEEDYTHFDNDIIMHINSVLFILRQAGIGPDKAFAIKDKTATWTEFISEDFEEFEAVKTYVYMKVRLIFDPPLSSAVMESLKELCREYEWRLNVEADTISLNGEEENQNGV